MMIPLNDILNMIRERANNPEPQDERATFAIGEIVTLELTDVNWLHEIGLKHLSADDLYMVAHITGDGKYTLMGKGGDYFGIPERYLVKRENG